MPSQPRRRLSAAERDAQIASAAVAVARRDGLAGVTLRSVAASVGVAPSLVAHYRPSMDELVGATFHTIATAEIREVRELVGRASRPVGRLAALLTAVTDPARDDVGALWSDAWSVGRSNPALAAVARSLMDDWQALATAIIAEGVRDGSMRAADPEGVAMLLFALVDAGNGYALVDYRSRAERNRLVVDTVARAVGLDPAALG